MELTQRNLEILFLEAEIKFMMTSLIKKITKK